MELVPATGPVVDVFPSSTNGPAPDQQRMQLKDPADWGKELDVWLDKLNCSKRAMKLCSKVLL